MSSNVIMPALGMAQDTGRLVAWLKNEGDTVTKGDPLMEVETDKTTVEVEANASGMLVNVSAQAGSDVPVGSVIAMIVSPGEAASDQVEKQSTAESETSIAVTPVARRLATDLGVDIRQIPSPGKRITRADVEAFASSDVQTRIPASPKARRLAVENGVTLAEVIGSGPNGAVIADDVIAVVAQSEKRPGAVEESQPKASTLWLRMAERLTESWQTVPHFYLKRSVNATGLVKWREQITSRVDQKITYTDFLVKLTAAALRHHPHLNGQWTGSQVAFNDAINIGLAVAVDDGLLVPVIHAADTLGVVAVAERRRVLVERAQQNRLQLADLQNGTFTISNLGMFDIDEFSAIVNPPQAAILAVGRVKDEVVAVAGQAEVRPMLSLSLSCDHRAVDGARGARFLDTLAQLIEDPLGMLD